MILARNIFVKNKLLMETAFLAELEKEYYELLTTGKIKIFEDVKAITSKQFSYATPQYYSGNIRSKVVLVNFNSKKGCLCNGNAPKDFETYKQVNQSLGEVFLEAGDEAEVATTYPYDFRTLNYLKPFNIIRFERESISRNLKKLTDEKLELGLLPFQAPDFGERDFMANYETCKPLVDRVLNGIVAYPRQYVVFVGSCFNNILSEYIEETESFRFLLTTPNCPNQKFIAHFTRITINYNSKRFIAGIAESFCDESFDSILIEKYGQESVAIINRGLLLASLFGKLTHRNAPKILKDEKI